MASKTAILAIKIVSDASRAPQGFNKTASAAQRMEQRVGKAAGVARLGLVSLAGASLLAARNAARDQRAQVLLAKAQRNAAGATNEQIRATEKYISKTSLAAGVSDDELRPALAALVRSTGNVKTAQAELNRALDVAAATGKPVEQVANAIAKAHGGQTSALSRLVPGISRAAVKSKDMNKIMAELARTTGGDAAAAANTAEGKVRRMSIAFDEAQESMGTALIPILLKASNVLMGLGVWLGNNTKLVTIIVGVLATLAAMVVTVNAVLAVSSSVMTIWSGATKAAALAQRVFNAAMRANPIGLVITAIGILIGLLVLAYKRSATFRGIVQAVGKAGQTALGWVVDKAKAVGTWLGKLGPAANKAKDIAVKAFKLYISPITLTIEAIKKLVGWIKNIKWPKPPKWLGKVAGKIGLGGAPKPPPSPGGGGSSPGGGAGGPGSGGGFSFSVGGGSGGGVTIIIQGAIDPVETARQIRRILHDDDVRNGRG